MLKPNPFDLTTDGYVKITKITFPVALTLLANLFQSLVEFQATSATFCMKEEDGIVPTVPVLFCDE